MSESISAGIFAFAATPTYEAQVIVETPAEKGGTWEKTTFFAEFQRVEVDDYEELIKKRPTEVLEQVLVGWRDLRGPDRRTMVEFTPDHKRAFLAVPQAVLAAFQKFVETQGKARVKN